MDCGVLEEGEVAWRVEEELARRQVNHGPPLEDTVDGREKVSQCLARIGHEGAVARIIARGREEKWVAPSERQEEEEEAEAEEEREMHLQGAESVLGGRKRRKKRGGRGRKLRQGREAAAGKGSRPKEKWAEAVFPGAINGKCQ